MLMKDVCGRGGRMKKVFDFKPGDLVSLSGRGWDKFGLRNEESEIVGRDEVGPRIALQHDDGQNYRVVCNEQFGDFSAELVEAAPLARKSVKVGGYTSPEFNLGGQVGVVHPPKFHFAPPGSKTAQGSVLPKVGALGKFHDQVVFRNQVRDVLKGLEKLLVEKNESYGDSALSPLGVFSKSDRVERLKVRIDDKLNRLYAGHEYGQEDTVTDLIGYLVLLKIAEQEEGK